ncbi:MarR family winged helix-turn-helix transcriptional regulator [Corynebacterium urogenitale]
MDTQQMAHALLLELRLFIKNFRGARVTSSLGLTYNEASILSTIRDNPALSSNDLATALQSDKSTISRQVSILKGKGLVEKRKREDNRRINEIVLTEQGRSLLAHSDKLWGQRVARRLRGWEPQEIEDFLRLLRQYNHVPLEEIDDRLPPG